MPKGKSNPDRKKPVRFVDPTVDAMRMMGRAFQKLEELSSDDKKLVLAWVNKKYIKGNKDINITT